MGGWVGTHAGSLKDALPGCTPRAFCRRARFTEMCKRCSSKVREAGTIAHPGKGQKQKCVRKIICKTR